MKVLNYVDFKSRSLFFVTLILLLFLVSLSAPLVFAQTNVETETNSEVDPQETETTLEPGSTNGHEVDELEDTSIDVPTNETEGDGLATNEEEGDGFNLFWALLATGIVIAGLFVFFFAKQYFSK